MAYSAKDYEFLGRQVAAGKFVARNTFLLSILLAVVLGGIAGRMTAEGSGGFAGGEEQRPLTQNGQGMTGNILAKEAMASILQHEEEGRKNPNNAENWEHLGNLYYDSNEPAKAIQAYEKHLALNPKNVSVIVDCGVMYRELKNFDKALELFRKAKMLDSKHEVAHFNEGIVLYHDLGRKEEGLTMWRKLLALNPQAKAPNGAPVAEMIKTLEAR